MKQRRPAGRSRPKQAQRKRADYDSPWKEALERYFPAFMECLFPVVYTGINWRRGYEFLDKELQQVARDAELGRRLADKLVRVFGHDGEEDWLLIHIEIQDQAQRDFARRMFVYNYRVFDRYERPVVSLAVLGDTDGHWRPDQFGYSRWGCAVGIRFPSVKLLDYRDRWEELEQSSNPFAVIVQTHLKAQETAGESKARFRWKLELIKSLYQRGYQRKDILELFRVIDWMLRLPEVLEERFWVELKSYEEARKMPYVTSVERLGITKGIQQGIQQGLVAERQLLLRMIRKRFGVEVANRSASLLEAVTDTTLLEEIGELLIACGDGEEWLANLRDKVKG